MRYVNFGAFAPPKQHCTSELGSGIRFFGAPIPDCSVDVTVVQEWLGHVSIHTTCGYKAIPIQTKREALRKFYLFDQSWQDTKSEAVDWNRYPDLLAFLESL